MRAGMVLDRARGALAVRVQTLVAPREVYVISYPKSGTTWLRVLLGKALCGAYGLPEAMIFETPALTVAAGLPRTEFSHDGAALKNAYAGRSLSRSKRRYRGKKVILLVREVKDLVVSGYFQATRRSRSFSGSISEFIRSEAGPKRIIDFYDLWYRARDVPREFLLIRYEEIHADPERILRLVLAFIGATAIDDRVVREAVEFARFENMQAMEAANLLGDVRLAPTDLADDESYKTRKGVVGGYTAYLSDDEVELIDRMVAEAGCPFLLGRGGALVQPRSATSTSLSALKPREPRTM